MITAEAIYVVFLSKTVFCLTTLYHFTFILLNISLYYENAQNLQDSITVAVAIQDKIVYFQIGILVLILILDFIPLYKAKCCWKNRLDKKEQGNRQ